MGRDFFKAIVITGTASSELKAGWCVLLKLDDVSASVDSWFRVLVF